MMEEVNKIIEFEKMYVIVKWMIYFFYLVL